MAAGTSKFERRRVAALAAIKGAFAAEGDDDVSLFVSHHLDELDGDYWRQQLATPRPTPEQVISLLELRSHWSEANDEELDTFDFTLPGDVTNYVIAVEFDEDGKVEQISMES